MNLKQQLFVTYYTEGDTKGNCEQSMLKAGYKPGYARKNSGKYIQAITGIKEAIDDAVNDIKEWMSGSRKLCDKLFMERYGACVARNDNTNAIRCVENKAKNVGYYALDNAQRTEQTKLDETKRKEVKRIAKLLNEDTIKEQHIIRLEAG